MRSSRRGARCGGGSRMRASYARGHDVHVERITMMKPSLTIAVALFGFATVSSPAAPAGDAARGQHVYRACAACHSLEPDRNMTGPSLSDLWNRIAGGLAS